MHSETPKKYLLVVLTMLLVTSGLVDGAQAQSRWRSHLDVSYVSEMVLRGNNLYVATFGGLLIYDIPAQRFAQYDNISGLNSNSLTALVYDGTGSWYLGTDDIGIVKVRLTTEGLSRQRTFNAQINGIASNQVTSIAKWGPNLVYGTTAGAGVIVNDFAAATFDTANSGLPSMMVNDVLEFDGDAWLATDAGVATINDVGFVDVVPGSPAIANVFAVDSSGIWVGTMDGVYVYDPVGRSWTDMGLHVPAQEIYSLFYDGQTMHAGATRSVWKYSGGGTLWTNFSLNPFYVAYSINGGLSHVQGLAVDGAGDTYVGAAAKIDRRGIGIVRNDGSASENLRPNAPGGNNVLRLSVEQDNFSVWASFSTFYVGKLNSSGQWINYNSSIPESNFLSNQFSNLAFLADSRGRKWFCTLSTPEAPVPMDRLDDGGDDDYSNDVWSTVGIGDGGGDGLGSLRLQRAAEDPAGNLWFLSDGERSGDGWSGIQIYNPTLDTWLQVNPAVEPRMADGDVSCVAFDATNGWTYVGMRSAGVQRWVHGGFSWSDLTNLADDIWSFKARPGVEFELSSIAFVEGLALSSTGRLWIGTSDGVYRTQDFGSRLTHIGAFRGFASGLLSAKVRDVVLDHQDNLWVATEFGLNRIDAQDVNQIEAYTTDAAYQQFLAVSQFPFEVISPLVHANCMAVAMHPTRDIVYVGTFGGMSQYDFSPEPPHETDLETVYVFPNPVYGDSHTALKIEGITNTVQIDIYNVEGQLVHSQSAETAGQSIWDLRTNNGYLASSGVYLVRVTGNTGSTVKSISIIR